MVCVDLKQSVMDFCTEIASKCGMNGMKFLCMNIDDYIPERNPDLVISLHACDIATDIVLGFAARHRADAVLSTPCCHHQMFAEMDCPALDFISERSILKQKMAAAATDALRLLKLEAEGYICTMQGKPLPITERCSVWCANSVCFDVLQELDVIDF